MKQIDKTIYAKHETSFDLEVNCSVFFQDTNIVFKSVPNYRKIQYYKGDLRSYKTRTTGDF